MAVIIRDPRERLRRWIAEACGGSQREAARRIGCDPSYVVHLLRDPRRRPGLLIATGIARATREWEFGPILGEEWLDSALTQQ